MARWQTTSFPTCNSLHEANVFSGSPTSFRLRHSARKGSDSLQIRPFSGGGGIDDGWGVPVADAAGAARLLGHGWFRHAWEVADASGAGLALKTLR